MEKESFLTKTRKIFEAYEVVCKPFCQEVGISVQAFEILMVIANNKGMITANDVCKKQNIKPTLMSFHIEKLVQAGYVERQAIEGNRRSIQLVCTENARPLIEKGIEINNICKALMWEGISQEEQNQFIQVVEKINANVDKILNSNIQFGDTKK